MFIKYSQYLLNLFFVLILFGAQSHAYEDYTFIDGDITTRVYNNDFRLARSRDRVYSDGQIEIIRSREFEFRDLIKFTFTGGYQDSKLSIIGENSSIYDDLMDDESLPFKPELLTSNWGDQRIWKFDLSTHLGVTQALAFLDLIHSYFGFSQEAVLYLSQIFSDPYDPSKALIENLLQKSSHSMDSIWTDISARDPKVPRTLTLGHILLETVRQLSDSLKKDDCDRKKVALIGHLISSLYIEHQDSLHYDLRKLHQVHAFRSEFTFLENPNNVSNPEEFAAEILEDSLEAREYRNLEILKSAVMMLTGLKEDEIDPALLLPELTAEYVTKLLGSCCQLREELK